MHHHIATKNSDGAHDYNHEWATRTAELHKAGVIFSKADGTSIMAGMVPNPNMTIINMAARALLADNASDRAAYTSPQGSELVPGTYMVRPALQGKSLIGK